MKSDVYLGVVVRDGSIFIPWQCNIIYMRHNFEPGQNLLVYFENGNVIKAELPTLEQLKQMKEELWSDWYRLAEIFRTASMSQKVLMLRSMDQAMRNPSWEN